MENWFEGFLSCSAEWVRVILSEGLCNILPTIYCNTLATIYVQYTRQHFSSHGALFRRTLYVCIKSVSCNSALVGSTISVIWVKIIFQSNKFRKDVSKPVFKVSQNMICTATMHQYGQIVRKILCFSVLSHRYKLVIVQQLKPRYSTCCLVLSEQMYSSLDEW